MKESYFDGGLFQLIGIQIKLKKWIVSQSYYC